MPTRFTPTDIVSQYNALTPLNANFDSIATLLDLCVFRDGTSPNSMLANLDMNSFKVQNLANGTANTDAVNKGQLDALETAVAADAAAASASATAAATSETNAASSASAAASSAADAAATAATMVAGTYTPTLTASANSSSPSLGKATYLRIGDIVQVSVVFSIFATAANTETLILMTLPVASNLASDTTDLIGSGSSQQIATPTNSYPVTVYANAASDRALVSFTPSVASQTHLVYVQFEYEVL